MKKFPITLLCGLIAVIVTILLFFTILGNILLEAIHFVCLAAIVLSEIIATAYAMATKGSLRKVAAAVVSAVMIPFSAVLSAVYIANFPQGYGTYLGWYFAGALTVNAVALILIFFDSKKETQSTSFQEAKEQMLYLRRLVKLTASDPAAQPYLQKLNALEEKLHFSNDTVIAPTDEALKLLLLQLQASIADTDFDVPAQIAKIEAAINQRSLLTSRNV